jgi:hypothetical protein
MKNRPCHVSGSRLVNLLLWLQGTYYLVTGAWPLISIRTFKLVTGERGKGDNYVTGLDVDHWLVMAVGVLITSIALALLVGAWRRSQGIELAVLAIAAAAGLTAIDAIYTSRGVIEPIYLLDAALEVPLIIAWIIALAMPRTIRMQSGDHASDSSHG